MKKAFRRNICFFTVLSLLPAITGRSMFVAAAEENIYGTINGDPVISEISLEAEEINLTGTAENTGERLFGPEKAEMIRVIIELEDPCVLDAGLEPGSLQALAYTDGLKAKQNSAALQMKETISQMRIDKETVEKIQPGKQFVNVMNGFEMSIPREALDKLASRPGVRRVFEEVAYSLPEVFENEYETEMFSSGSMIGAAEANLSGYNGEGMLIGILDTGLDMTHSAFLSDPLSPKIQEGTEFGGTNKTGTYKSARIPFGYDYANNDNDPTDTHTHGTHVAGIIAGRDMIITGIAPEAQLAIFKVFPDNSRNTSDSYIISALEDAVIIKPDVINMSLGSPAGDDGSTYYANFQNEYISMKEIYQRVSDAGISLSISAGNESYMGYSNSVTSTENPHIGIVGSPASYDASVAVASIENTNVVSHYLNIGGYRILFHDPFYGTDRQFSTLSSSLPLYIEECGTGTVADYSNIDIRGKAALVQYSEDISIAEQQKNAADFGALAIIIRNTGPGTINAEVDPASIPCITISNSEYEVISRHVYQMRINSIYEAEQQDNYDAYKMSDFSSWGLTDDFRIKPEITAPGGRIFSSVIGGYDSYSGTSMAAPHAAASMALIRQYLKSSGIAADAGQLNQLAVQIAMSTAEPVAYGNGLYYSPRVSGAGLININNAIRTSSYLSVENTPGQRPKIECGEDPQRTGVYTLSFDVHNLLSDFEGYSITAVVQADGADGQKLSVSPVALDYVLEGDRTVSVRKGSSKTVNVTIRLSDTAKQYLDQTFPNGDFVEGYIILTPDHESGVQLSLPFAAYYGDRNDLPLLDVTADHGSEAVSGMNGYFSYAAYRQYHESSDWFVRYVGRNPVYPETVSYKDYLADAEADAMTVTSSVYSPLESDPSLRRYDRTRNLGIYAAQICTLQNVNWYRFRIINSDTGAVYYDNNGVSSAIRKNEDQLDRITYWNNYQLNWTGTDENGVPLPEGTQCVFEIQVSRDNGNNIQSVTMPVFIDNTKPKLASSADPSVSEDSVITSADAVLMTTAGGKKYLSLSVTDNNYVAAVQAGSKIDEVTEYAYGAYSSAQYTYKKLGNITDSFGFPAEEKGTVQNVLLDVTDISDTYYAAVTDYAGLKTLYALHPEQEKELRISISPEEKVLYLNGNDLSYIFHVTDQDGNLIGNDRFRWSVDGARYYRTDIENGKLTVSRYETECELSITAEAIDDESLSASAKIILKTDPGLRIYGRSLSLDGYIGVNYYISIPQEDVSSTVIRTSLNGKEQLMKAADADTRVIQNEAYYKFTVLTVAKEMKDIITVTAMDDAGNPRRLYDPEGNNVTGGYSDSVQGYLSKALASPNAKLVSLAEAMNNYGDYAQIYFNYNTVFEPDELEDVSFVSEQTVADYQSAVNGAVSGMEYYGASLELESDTGFRLHFRLQDGHSISEYGFTLDDKTIQPVHRGGNIWSVQVRNIAGKELGDFKTLKINRGNETLSIRYCALSYVYTALTSDKAREEAGNVSRALYLYYLAAKVYFS